jgi:hypothetical protein
MLPAAVVATGLAAA